MVNDSSDSWLMSEKWKARKIPLYYVLDYHTPIPSYEMGEFIRLCEDFDARKVNQTLVGRSTVSTVFWGVNISLDETPKFFQSKVLGDSLLDELMLLSETWEEAAATHQVIVDVLTSELETQYQRDYQRGFYILSFSMAIAMLVFQIVR